MKKKICIVTGGNAGIGKQSAIQMAKEGFHVIIACRNQQRGEQALKDIVTNSGSRAVELALLDLSLSASTRSFAADISHRFQQVDVLIHNAAIFDISQKEVKFTSEGKETVWMTNHVNPVYLTYLLLDLLKASDNGRIITVSSKGLLAKPFLKIDPKDPEFRRRKFSMTNAYYQSKRAQVMFTYYLAKELKDTNVTVNSVRVTAVQVDINRHPDISKLTRWIYRQKSKQSITPQAMAKTYTYLATSPELNQVTGKYFDEKNQQVQSNKYTYDQTEIDRVMALTHSFMEEGVN